MLSFLAAAQFAFAPSAVAPSVVAPSAVAPHARVVVGETGLDAVSAALRVGCPLKQERRECA